MGILFFCIGLVFCAIVLHLISLRIQKPLSNNPPINILLIFLIVLAMGLMLAYFLNKKYSFLPRGILENLHVLICYLPLMLSYSITYVAVVDDSPSMTIVRFVEQAQEKGRSRRQISQIMTDEALILPRIRVMVKDGWIEYRNNRYQITAKGRFYNRIFALGVKALHIPRGG